MAIKTESYNSEDKIEIPEQKIDDILRDFIIWSRDVNMEYKIDDYHGRGYIIDDAPVNIEEILKKYKEENL